MGRKSKRKKKPQQLDWQHPGCGIVECGIKCSVLEYEDDSFYILEKSLVTGRHRDYFLINGNEIAFSTQPRPVIRNAITSIEDSPCWGMLDCAYAIDAAERAYMACKDDFPDFDAIAECYAPILAEVRKAWGFASGMIERMNAGFTEIYAPQFLSECRQTFEEVYIRQHCNADRLRAIKNITEQDLCWLLDGFAVLSRDTLVAKNILLKVEAAHKAQGIPRESVEQYCCGVFRATRTLASELAMIIATIGKQVGEECPSLIQYVYNDIGTEETKYAMDDAYKIGSVASIHLLNGGKLTLHVNPSSLPDGLNSYVAPIVPDQHYQNQPLPKILTTEQPAASKMLTQHATQDAMDEVVPSKHKNPKDFPPPREGELSQPLSLAEIARRTGQSDPRKAKVLLDQYGLRQTLNRQNWTVELTKLPPDLRKRLES
jgi:hypothetical protein